MFLIVLVLLILAGIGAAIASGKGRNPWGWFALCFLFFLPAFIVLLFLPNIKKQELENSKQCPECAERVLKEAMTCKHCSYKFSGNEKIASSADKSVNESLGI
ncbi:hypothetical protein [Neptunicella sp.]|uniref:hypothetical protein n=1 Tax=Neptunicella sp. TaxID=2125986 RepID=UPI003F68C83F